MNINYSGDTRDLFKFDLVRHLMKNVPGLERFTFIPMLTEEKIRSGQKRSSKKDIGRAIRNGSAGTLNRELMEHMGRLQEIDSDMEYFNGVKSYFLQEKILVDILHPDTFSHENRTNYFAKMFAQFPARSLIYLDPDIGLEIRKPTQRHLLYKEVKMIYDRMDESSILMIYQHFPRRDRAGYIRKRCNELSSVTGARPASVTDNEIVFFLLARNPVTGKKLPGVAADYAKKYSAVSTVAPV